MHLGGEVVKGKEENFRRRRDGKPVKVDRGKRGKEGEERQRLWV